LSDEDRSVGAAYGTLREPPADRLPRRHTFLIDPLGVVVKRYSVKDTAAHPDEVLADLRSFQGLD